MIEKDSFNRNKNWNFLSWNSLLNNLYKVQNRLFKCVYVLDMTKALAFQKLILSVNQ
jgi:hypothetical protein